MSNFFDFVKSAVKGKWAIQVDLEGFPPCIVQLLSENWSGPFGMIEVQGMGDDGPSWMAVNKIIFMSKIAESKEEYEKKWKDAKKKALEESGEILSEYVGFGKSDKVH